MRLRRNCPERSERITPRICRRMAAASACSDSAENEAKTFFEPHMKDVIGGQRSLANALEQIHLCAAAKPAAEQQISKFLSAYPAKSTATGGAQ